MREYNTTSTSIFVIWDDVPSEDQNGIIRRYTVRYRSVRVEGPFNTTTVFTKEANLTGLIKDESYNVSVLVTIDKGNGPYSVLIIHTTNENSEYFETLFGIAKQIPSRLCFFFCEHDPFDNGKYSKNQLLRHPLDRQL